MCSLYPGIQNVFCDSQGVTGLMCIERVLSM